MCNLLTLFPQTGHSQNRVAAVITPASASAAAPPDNSKPAAGCFRLPVLADRTPLTLLALVLLVEGVAASILEKALFSFPSPLANGSHAETRDTGVLG